MHFIILTRKKSLKRRLYSGVISCLTKDANANANTGAAAATFHNYSREAMRRPDRSHLFLKIHDYVLMLPDGIFLAFVGRYHQIISKGREKVHSWEIRFFLAEIYKRRGDNKNMAGENRCLGISGVVYRVQKDVLERKQRHRRYFCYY